MTAAWRCQAAVVVYGSDASPKNIMPRRKLAASLMLVAQSTVGAVTQARLEPDESAFASLQSEYYLGVRRALLKDVPFAAAAVVVLPSFEVEWAVWIMRDPQPSVCSRTASRKIWNADQPERPHVPVRPTRPKCIRVAREILEDLSDRWVAMLRNVAYPPPGGTIGLDGTSYHFSTLDQGQKLAGQIWSPEPNSTTGRFVAVAEALRAYTSSPSLEAAASLCELIAAVQPDGRRLMNRCSRRAEER